MSLVVYDMGQRIETPMRPPSRKVSASHAAATVKAIDEQHTPQEHARQQPNEAIQAYQQQEERHPAIVAFIRDILHRNVKTLTPENTLQEAWQRLQQTGHHNLPIINSQRQVLAMFSEGDFLRAITQQERSPLATFWQTNIMNLATRPVLCVQEQTDIHQTSQLLYEYNIGALPVVDQENKLCGIVTRSDILRLLSHYGPLELWA